MIFETNNTTRPNRAEDKKDKDYHLKMGQYTLNQGFNNIHQKWLKSIYVNKNFYKGDQWTLEEDIQTFLSDESGSISTRIKFVQNLIRPMVEQYRGNAIILNVNASAKSLSRNSINRREKRLAEQILKTRTANEFPGVGKAIRENDISIGDDEAQTEQIFESVYVDKLTGEINELLQYSKRLNRFQKKQVQVALNLALTGLGVQQSILHGGHQRFNTVQSEDFFFDRDAREIDLSDAEFMGTIKPTAIPMIAERWNLDPADAKALEDYASVSSGSTVISPYSRVSYSSNKPPVVTSYWKDMERYKYGWVLDEDEYPVLARIGKDSDSADLDDETKYYTEEDLITPPDTPKNRMLFPNGKKTAMLYCDVLRYVMYIPGEIVGNKKENGKFSDIVLEFGKDPYQDTNLQDLSNVKFPFQVHTWGYVDGEIFSPVDDVISPQRFINRMLSLTEQRFNSSGGSNVILDEDSVDNIIETQQDIKEGKPITVRSRGKGIPNTVGVYNAMPNQSTYNMFGAVSQMKALMQDVTGVNEAIKGESTGSDQLVGVTELQIQRGSILQEPFYYAVSEIFLQMYESVASVGKKYYIDNERELAIISGDEGIKIFKLSKELRNEDFQIFIERENSDEALASQANQMLQVFMEMGLIDDVVFANLYNSATPTKVMQDVKTFVKKRKEAERRAAEDAQAQEQQMMQQAQQSEQAMMQNENAKEAMKLGADREKQMMINQGKVDEILTKGYMENQRQASESA